MTQKTDIFSFLLKNPNARPIEISKALKIPSPSVRRAIFELRKQKVLTKPIKSGKKKGTARIRKTKATELFKKLIKKVEKIKEEIEEIEIEEIEEEEEIIIYRKSLGLTLYCSREEKNFKAIIFEEYEFPDREQDLRSALINWTRNDCGEIEKANLGYEVDEWYDIEELGVITFEADD